MSEKYFYDQESDSIFICIHEGEEERFEEIVPGVNIELDENGEILGVEILNASRFLKDKDIKAA